MGAIVMVLGLLVVSPALAAPVFDDPQGLIEYAYIPYAEGELTEDRLELLSPTLIELWQAMEERTPEDEVGAVNFDPFINGQEVGLEALSISDPVMAGDSAVVVVTFTNASGPQQIRFTLVRRVEGWKIDDIESLTPGNEWRLSTLLAADPLLN